MKIVCKNGGYSLCRLIEALNLGVGVSLPLLFATIESISLSIGTPQLDEKRTTWDSNSPNNPSGSSLWHPSFSEQKAFGDSVAASASASASFWLEVKPPQVQVLLIFFVFCYRRLAPSHQGLYGRIQCFVSAILPNMGAKFLTTKKYTRNNEINVEKSTVSRGNWRTRRYSFQIRASMDYNLLDIALYSVIVTGVILPQRFSLFTSPCRPFTTNLPQCQDFVHSPATYLASFWLIVGLILVLDYALDGIIRLLNALNQHDQSARVKSELTLTAFMLPSLPPSPSLMRRTAAITMAAWLAFGKPSMSTIWFPDSGRPLFSPFDIVKEPMLNCIYASGAFVTVVVMHWISGCVRSCYQRHWVKPPRGNGAELSKAPASQTAQASTKAAISPFLPKKNNQRKRRWTPKRPALAPTTFLSYLPSVNPVLPTLEVYPTSSKTIDEEAVETVGGPNVATTSNNLDVPQRLGTPPNSSPPSTILIEPLSKGTARIPQKTMENVDVDAKESASTIDVLVNNTAGILILLESQEPESYQDSKDIQDRQDFDRPASRLGYNSDEDDDLDNDELWRPPRFLELSDSDYVTDTIQPQNEIDSNVQNKANELIKLIKLIKYNETRELDEQTHYSHYSDNVEYLDNDTERMEEIDEVRKTRSKPRLVEAPSLQTIEEVEEEEDECQGHECSELTD